MQRHWLSLRSMVKMLAHYCSRFQPEFVNWILITMHCLSITLIFYLSVLMISLNIYTCAVCWYNWLTVDFISKSLSKSSSFFVKLDCSQDIRSELGKADLFRLPDKLILKMIWVILRLFLKITQRISAIWLLLHFLTLHFGLWVIWRWF